MSRTIETFEVSKDIVDLNINFRGFQARGRLLTDGGNATVLKTVDLINQLLKRIDVVEAHSVLGIPTEEVG